MDTAQWPQEIVVKPMEEIVTNTCPKPISSNHNTIERKLTRPQKEQAINCPRCNSTHTKFCYYNNYSLTQPRYFCKTCRRYWTEGGSLRNIPVGGGSRKNKRPSSSPSSKINNITKLPDLVHAQKNSTNNNNNNNNNVTMINNNNNNNQGQDLNLGFASTITTSHDFISSKISDLVHQLPNDNDQSNNTKDINNNSNHVSALELLTGLTSKGFNSFIPMPVYCNTIISPNEFKPSLSFSLDGLGNGGGYGSLQESDSTVTNNGRLLFPFEDLRQNSKEQGDSSANGYWTGMLGGGSW